MAALSNCSGAIPDEDRRSVSVDGAFRRIKGMRDSIHNLLDTILDDGTTLLGQHTKDLEQTVSERWGGWAVATASGTDSLYLSLLVADVRPGDEGIVPDMTFASTAFAVNMAHAVPVFVDVEPSSWLISPESVEQAITGKTKAIIPVHLYGQMCDMDAIRTIAQQRGIAIIEDCAQAHGATYKGAPAGSIGDFGCFSLWYGKNVGGLDDGGLVLTRQYENVAKLRQLQNLGRDQQERYLHKTWGCRSRLSELNAAVVRHQIDLLPEWNRKRASIATAYNDALTSLPLRTPVTLPGREHVFYKYVVHSEDSCKLEEHLTKSGIETERIYPYLLSEQPAFASLPHRAQLSPIAKKYNRNLLCLPLYPELTYEEQQAVIESVCSFY
jgi:dTDP-4-amino-4,6-dideoxygalactose transaminase